MTPSPSPSTQVDPVTAAGFVSERFERWFAERALELPAETRAQFVEMGMEALQRWPDRAPGDVLDELTDELDQRLETITSELAHEPARTDTTAPTQRGALSRLFARRERRPR